MTLKHALLAAAGNTGPAPTPSDPQFNYVSMLLHGDGTNGAQNNTFTASPTLAPAGGFLAGYFDGDGDYLQTPTDTALNFSSVDYTVEAWVYLSMGTYSSYDQAGRGIASDYLSNSFGRWILYVDTSGKLGCAEQDASGQNSAGISDTANMPLNQWVHTAICKSGTTLYLFKNGALVGTTTSAVRTSFGGRLNIGQSTVDPGYRGYFLGYIANVRAVKGTAVYTAAFTPPTAPLTAISGTSLLTCVSGYGSTFADASVNNFTVTRNGNASMNSVATTPPGAVPYAGYLDGSGDYLTVPAGAAFAYGTGAFTIEGWVYLNGSGENTLFAQTISGTNYLLVGISYGVPYFVYATSGGGTSIGAGITIALNTWAHIAVVREGTGAGQTKIYVNGALSGSGACAQDFSNTTYVPTIGRYSHSATYEFNGYVSNFRVVKGTAVYTSNFAPPSSPLTAISGTSLLTCQSATFVDNSPNAFTVTAYGNATVTSSYILPTITRVGNAAQGSLSPYGNLWSNYFDGTGDWLTAPSNSAFDQTGDFTFETWVRVDATVTGTYSNFGNVFSQETPNIFKFGFNKSRQFVVLEAGAGSPALTSATIFAIGVWYHVAVVRSGMSTNNLKLYVNGVQEAQTTKTNSVASANTTFIGREAWSGDPGTLTGAISNLRYVKGAAVYTSNFTPPTAPLTAISGTSLLTCQSNRFIDNSANNFTITVIGDVRVTKESPFLPAAAYSTSTIGGSGYFDGSGDYLTVPNNTALNLSSGDWTIELWVWWNGGNSEAIFIDKDGVGASTYPSYDMGVNGSGYARVIVGNGSANAYFQIINSGTLLPKQSWVHLAAVKSGSTITLYQNGVNVVSATQTGTIVDGGKPLYIGYQQNQPAYLYLDGYLSNVRIVKGTAVYTANFTPPTAPLTATINTSLLLNFTNAGIFDNAAENVMETVGDAKISSAQSKFGTGSLAFDGTGDWLLVPDSPSIRLGSGVFTIECWIYRTTSGTAQAFIGKATSITTGWEMGINSSNEFFFADGSTVQGSNLIPLNTWTHVAVVRIPVFNGTTLYINGVSYATMTSGTDFSDSGALYIGAGRTGRLPFTGYIDDLRITKGVARYTGSFTPPSAPFPDK